RAVPSGVRVPWYGPPMSAASMATARLMETWAHGLDVADALGVERAPTARLRHIARLGVRTRDFAYAVHGLTPPAEPFRVELTAPGGELWTYGPEDAAQRVTGPGLDFCLLVTQRAHRADLALTAVGPDADRWLDIAQAFAGPPGGGRAPKGDAS
ncbi:TIGR03084 family protein, partial [Streptomyces sp. SID7958]